MLCQARRRLKRDAERWEDHTLENCSATTPKPEDGSPMDRAHCYTELTVPSWSPCQEATWLEAIASRLKAITTNNKKLLGTKASTPCEGPVRFIRFKPGSAKSTEPPQDAWKKERQSLAEETGKSSFSGWIEKELLFLVMSCGERNRETAVEQHVCKWC